MRDIGTVSFPALSRFCNAYYDAPITSQVSSNVVNY